MIFVINWVHDIIIVVISSTLAALVAGTGWLFRRRRERINARLLVASEISDNYSLLITFLEMLQAISPQDRLRIALRLDEVIQHYTPQWLRVRWDSVPLGAFSPREVYQIASWYHQLQIILDTYRYLLAQSISLRQKSEKMPAEQQASEFIVEILTQLENSAQSLSKQGRPFVDKRLDKATKKVQKLLNTH